MNIPENIDMDLLREIAKNNCGSLSCTECPIHKFFLAQNYPFNDKAIANCSASGIEAFGEELISSLKAKRILSIIRQHMIIDMWESL